MDLSFRVFIVSHRFHRVARRMRVLERPDRRDRREKPIFPYGGRKYHEHGFEK